VRLFIALELPAAAVGELVSWRRSVLAAKAGLRPVPPESMHVTLAFLGEREPASVDALLGALDAVAGAGAAPLALGSPWWLPRRRPGVLAVAIEDDDGLLHETQGLLLSALRRAIGFEPERRVFFPHVTVARVRRGFRVRPAPLDGPPAVEFTGTRVTLFESAGGYRPLHSVEL
jgi:2'-5' RNA ligase